MARLKQLLLALLLTLLAAPAAAATFNFTPGSTPAASLCSSFWSVSGSTFTCNFGRVTLNPGDSITASSAITINAPNGFRIRGNQLGSSSAPVNLVSSYGSVEIDGTTVFGNVQNNAGIDIEDAVVNGNVTSQYGDLVVQNTTVNGNLTSNSEIEVTDESVINGNVLSNGNEVVIDDSNVNGNVQGNNGVTLDNTAVSGSVTAPNGPLEFEDSIVQGPVTTPCCTLISEDSQLLGGGEIQSGMEVDGGVLQGDFILTAANEVTLDNITMPSGSIQSASTVEISNSELGTPTSPVYVNAIAGDVEVNDSIIYGELIAPDYAEIDIDSNSSVNAYCFPSTPECNDAGAPPQVQRPLAWCGDVWQEGSAGGGFYPTDYVLPEEALNEPLPANLEPGDYLRRGNFGDVGENYTTSGATSRLFIDGDLTIQSGRRLNIGGPAENLLIIVTGNLTIEADVRINGYIFAEGNINLQRGNFGPQRSIFNGAITAQNNLSQTGGRPGGTATINYQPVPSSLAGGGFCLATPKNELYLQFNDGPWGSNPGDVFDSSANNLPVQAVNNPQFDDTSSALVNDVNGFGTCGYADLERSSSQGFQVESIPAIEFAGSFTTGTWFRLDSYPPNGQFMTLMGAGEEFEVSVTREGGGQAEVRMRWMNRNNNDYVRVDTGSQIALNTWYYIAFRYQPRAQSWFLFNDSGAEIDSATVTQNSPLRPIEANFEFGNYSAFPSNDALNGNIDETQLFRGALTNAEIAALPQQRSFCDDTPLTCFAEDGESDTLFGETWTSSTSSGNFTPAIVDGRVRLTEASQEQSTRITLNRSFPAAGNRLEFEFSLYAYGGNAADGIAVVLSDADVQPESGSFGGSLGYAQRDTGDPGFAGGWLGIGFDEFGNFSKAAEGRVGGDSPGGLSPDRVALRGAEQNGYPFLKNSVTLSPGIDSTGGTPGPGHTYRIVVDSRVAGTSVISVERDTNNGNGYQTVIAPFNVFAEFPGQQPVVPDDFLVSFTGSTGENFNIHEFDDLQICAIASEPIIRVVDHFRLSHDDQGIACLASPVTVTVCGNDDCSQQIGDPVDVTLETTAGNWANGSSQTVTRTVNGGSDTFALRNIVGGPAEISVANSAPTPQNPTRCFIGTTESDCIVDFANAGLAFYDADGLSPIANQVAGTNFAARLRAVETNTLTGACEARVEGTQTVNLGYECRNPGSCIAGQTLSHNDDPLGANDLGSSANTTPLELTFDAQGYAPLDLVYTDVGEVQLHANLQLDEDGVDPGLPLIGTSNPFVVKPYSVVVIDAENSEGEANPGTTSSGRGFTAAGRDFSTLVEVRNALGQATPNFGNEDDPEVVTVNFGGLVYPNPGVGTAGLLQNNGSFETNGTTGQFINSEISWHEAGTITLTGALDDNDYLGAGDIVDQPASGAIGRFYPNVFNLSASQFTDACGSFSYMNQPQIETELEIEALGESGNILANYTSGNYDGTAEIGFVAKDDAAAATSLGSRLTVAAASWEEGVYTLNDLTASFARLADDEPDGPYEELDIGVYVASEIDSRRFAGLDFDASAVGPCSGSDCSAVQVSGQLDLRFGRYVLENIGGPETELLPVVLRADYWDGERFVPNIADNCSMTDFNSLRQLDNSEVPGNEALDVSPTGSNGALLVEGENAQDSLLWTPPANASPDNLGEFIFEYESPAWLQFEWLNDDDETHINPRAIGSFGQYRGNDRIIYWRETGW